jgi:hypothetical protein
MLTFVGVIGCFSSDQPTVSGPVRCARPANGKTSFGCAVITGNVVGADGRGMDGIVGAVRTTPQCGCLSMPIEVDSLGRFSATVHRTEARATWSPDTATIVVYMGAAGTKYPRSVTGDPYNDTVSVHLTYVPIGDEAQVYTLGLRILFP